MGRRPGRTFPRGARQLWAGEPVQPLSGHQNFAVQANVNNLFDKEYYDYVGSYVVWWRAAERPGERELRFLSDRSPRRCAYRPYPSRRPGKTQPPPGTTNRSNKRQPFGCLSLPRSQLSCYGCTHPFRFSGYRISYRRLPEHQNLQQRRPLRPVFFRPGWSTFRNVGNAHTQTSDTRVQVSDVLFTAESSYQSRRHFAGHRLCCLPLHLHDPAFSGPVL